MLYTDNDKNNYYLGMISQVYKDTSVVQIENLSWLKFKKLRKELIIPNTINYLVIVESVSNLFLGEVYQSKIPNTDSVHNALLNNISEKIYPELNIDLIGVLSSDSNNFKLPGFSNVGLTDRVYFSNKRIIEIYLQSIELKSKYADSTDSKLKSFAKFSNAPSEEVSLYTSTLFDRHLMSIGTTNSGKSTSSLSILDKLIINNKKLLIIDPTGEYSDSFDENENIKKLSLGINTVVDAGRLTFSQWATLFETNDSSQPAVLADAIKSLRYQKKKGIDNTYIKVGKTLIDVANELSQLDVEDTSFELSLLSSQITEEAVELDKSMKKYITGSFQFNQKQWLVQKIDYKLTNTNLLKFFSQKTDGKFDLIEEVDKFLNNTDNHSLYINTSTIGVSDSIGGMIIDLISTYIIDKKQKNNIAFVMFIDEVHRYSKVNDENNFQFGLTNIAREGRKKGIF
ncbi:DUF87 domain-containing protein [Staphylococcus delphini]|uniref:helicase HerA domain-containing protein n=2 Tax=Staphylococcus delphini TaxID=53344 RepID=UPI0021CEDE54|nr:DUF87 domain-containing protein [Staphylococcus delphini]UXS30445.1 DUF87 domain-containing protein [Staphylococcus delphini]